ncbi:unnamed protein product [Triticum aestivum]|uniref:Uncharacterized protein n=1 Tax=Triticum aestivum TaxID=4565 RepID=A0A7H4LBP2_WHEAT|nr:unnamed protein product [Triticum aestivum]
MGMSSYKMVYGKACHLPLKLEHKAYWAIKELNYDFKLAGEKRLFDIGSLDEWRTQAYENAKLFKEKVKRWHDKRIQKREFNVGDYVLLFNSRLRFFAGKLLSKWEAPYVIEEVYRSGVIKINNFEGTNPKVVNGQRIKQYISGLYEEGECRQLEFWAGKGANIRDLFCATPKVVKLHGS